MRKIIEILSPHFAALGFQIIHSPKHKNASGPDLWVKAKNERPLSVEIKICRNMKNGTLQVPPIESARQKDDLIAILISNYVLIEPMAQHLNSCCRSGTRQLTLMRSGS